MFHCGGSGTNPIPSLRSPYDNWHRSDEFCLSQEWTQSVMPIRTGRPLECPCWAFGLFAASWVLLPLVLSDVVCRTGMGSDAHYMVLRNKSWNKNVKTGLLQKKQNGQALAIPRFAQSKSGQLLPHAMWWKVYVISSLMFNGEDFRGRLPVF